jgi:hypothetical protein
MPPRPDWVSVEHAIDVDLPFEIFKPRIRQLLRNQAELPVRKRRPRGDAPSMLYGSDPDHLFGHLTDCERFGNADCQLSGHIVQLVLMQSLQKVFNRWFERDSGLPDSTKIISNHYRANDDRQRYNWKDHHDYR